MSENRFSRRQFVAAASAASLTAAASTAIPAYGKIGPRSGTLAILGGEPVRKNKPWPKWPYRDENVLKSVEETTVTICPPRLFGCCMIALACSALFGTPALLDAAENSADDAKGTNILACRLANYQKFQDAAWSHLPSIGFKYIFLNVPPPNEVDALQERLDRHGLKVAVVRGDTDLSRPTSVEELAEQLKTCQRLGVRTMFLSPKHPGVGKEIACERLRRAGDIAGRYGVTIALETHPDMGTNGDEHVQTMKRINHPNVRVNFDTGNITYYNHDTDAARELKKCIEYVAAVEFKDHNGQFETWNFPTIGRGAVDFRAVMKILRDHGYAGPITMEVEGVRGVEMSEEEIKEYVDRSARHIRSLGTFE